VSVTVTQRQAERKRKILERQRARQLKKERAILRVQCLAARPRITHDEIAQAYGCTRWAVVHFFAGRRSPRGMSDLISRMLRAKRGAA
jgi:hypothetical protein